MMRMSDEVFIVRLGGRAGSGLCHHAEEEQSKCRIGPLQAGVLYKGQEQQEGYTPTRRLKLSCYKTYLFVSWINSELEPCGASAFEQRVVGSS